MQPTQLSTPNNSNPINNPLTQLARMYALIEGALRFKIHTIEELRNLPEIKAAEKSTWQVADIVRTLYRKGHLIQGNRDKTTLCYSWDTDSPPFIFKSKQRKQATKAPSKPTIIKPNSPNGPISPISPINQTAFQIPTKEIELVFDGTIVVIGKNPETGRIRITIES